MLMASLIATAGEPDCIPRRMLIALQHRQLVALTHGHRPYLASQTITMWLGDGHFHNTLHNDPWDNFLCQLQGTRQ